MRLVDTDATDRELFYKECMGKDSLISVESAYDMLMALPEVKAVPVETLDKIREEIQNIEIEGRVDANTMFVRTAGQVKNMALEIIDKYRNEVNE